MNNRGHKKKLQTVISCLNGFDEERRNNRHVNNFSPAYKGWMIQAIIIIK